MLPNESFIGGDQKMATVIKTIKGSNSFASAVKVKAVHPNPDRVFRKTLGGFLEKLWPDLHRREFHVFEQTPELFKKLQSLRESPRKN